ncbi:MAG: GNAT family N-acetyltransferase [Caldilineaceae bacterium]
MIPAITPSLIIRPLRMDETPLIGYAINSLLRNTSYSIPMEETELKDQLLHSQPPTLYQARWQRHCRLCAWRAGELEGFLDAATGFDQDNLDLPDYQPIGILRFLVLPAKVELVEEVAAALLAGAEEFWRSAGIGYVKAFHMSTGYPAFQAGLGVLPGDWTTHMRILTGADFRLHERFYCLRRALDQPVEELTPLAQLSLVPRGKLTDRHYHVYRQTEWIGAARITSLRQPEEQRAVRIANLVDFRVAPDWRQRDIGKWLLRRIINDAITQGYHQMLVHVPHRAHAAINLLNQLGFQEENYRGYTMEKVLIK